MIRARKTLQASLLAVLLASVATLPAGAQEAKQETPPETQQGAQQGDVLPPAYDDQMMRLAEILGSLHYLRALCGAEEGQRWRDEMEAMLTAEEPTPQRRTELIARFNRGYRGYREVYRECTPAAAEAANRHLRQGVRIAGEIPGRYGR